MPVVTENNGTFTVRRDKNRQAIVKRGFTSRKEADLCLAEIENALSLDVTVSVIKELIAAKYLKPTGKPKGITINELVHLTNTVKWSHNKTTAQFNRAKSIAKYIGRDTLVTSITPEFLDDLLNRLVSDGLEYSTIEKWGSTIRIMLGVAGSRGLLKAIPEVFTNIKVSRETKARTITDTEWKRILKFTQGTDKQFHDVLLLAMYTGARPVELEALTWGDVTTRKRDGAILLRLRTAKWGMDRTIPIPKGTEVFTLLRNRFFKGEETPIDRLSIRNRFVKWRNVKSFLGIKDSETLTFYSIRHTRCTELISRKIRVEVVQKFMGHVSIQTTMRYVHLNDDCLDEIIEL